jgi:antitoxin component YwqK of YwqJK toxin-antitoxin module
MTIRATLLEHVIFVITLHMTGLILIDNYLYEYKSGLIDGLVTVYDQKIENISYSYNQHKDQKEGTTTFYFPNSDSTVIGIYKDGYPFEGYVYDGGKLCQYQEGVREGTCTIFNKDGTPTSVQHYQRDVLNGLSEYYGYKPLGVIAGTYVNKKPMDGYFQSEAGGYQIDYYENGVKLSRTKYSQDSFKIVCVESYLNQTITQYLPNGDIRFQGMTKNNKPFEGTFQEGRDIRNYKEGKLHGRAEYYDYDNKLARVENYENGKLEGPYITYAKKKIIKS